MKSKGDLSHCASSPAFLLTGIPYGVEHHKANPDNVRLYIRAMRGQFPLCNFQRRLLKMMLKEITTVQEMVERSHAPVKIKLGNRYAGLLKWTGEQFLIAKRGAKPLYFSYHQLENIIINNQFSLQ